MLLATRLMLRGAQPALFRCSSRAFGSSSSSSSSSLSASPDDFVSEMRQREMRRLSFIWDAEARKLEASHADFAQCAESIAANKRDFDAHEAVFLEVGRRSNALLGAFVHKTVRGQAAGGVRLWGYNSMESYINDGLRLAQGMGRKSALAGLWLGGGKGVICRPTGSQWTDPAFREQMFRDYGDFITSLRGCYIAAEDVGVTTDDLEQVFRRTRFATCIPPQIGGSGNPSQPTALGVVCAMEGALDFLRMGDLRGKRIAIQGLGNVAGFMIDYLLQKGVGHIFATDINQTTLDRATVAFRGQPVQLELVSPGDNSSLLQDADIVSPCALGGILNQETIPKIRAKIVCGAANNQLLDDRVDDLTMKKHNILFVPDYVANRMGIVNCGNEQYGYLDNDPAIQRHFGREWENSIFVITQRVLETAANNDLSTSEAARRLADVLSLEPHPIWGHRGAQIIQSLKRQEWHLQ